MSEVFRSWWILHMREISAALASESDSEDVMDALEILFSRAFHAGIRCAIRAAEEIEQGKQERVNALIHSIEQEKKSPPVCEECKGSGYIIKRDGNVGEFYPCTHCIKVR